MKVQKESSSESEFANISTDSLKLVKMDGDAIFGVSGITVTSVTMSSFGIWFASALYGTLQAIGVSGTKMSSVKI